MSVAATVPFGSVSDGERVRRAEDLPGETEAGEPVIETVSAKDGKAILTEKLHPVTTLQFIALAVAAHLLEVDLVSKARAGTHASKISLGRRYSGYTRNI